MYRIALVLVTICISMQVSAELMVRITDGNQGAPIKLPGAVLWLLPKGGVDVTELSPKPADMEQLNRQFKPFVLAVQKGAPVTFPNRDQTAHHVYSFSKPITFELPLYKKVTPKPVTFDKAGLVPLGCNIHDWMIAYIMVVDTPFFTQFTQNQVVFDELPHGEYEVKLWHPAISATEKLSQTLHYDGESDIEFALYQAIERFEQPKAPDNTADAEEDY